MSVPAEDAAAAPTADGGSAAAALPALVTDAHLRSVLAGLRGLGRAGIRAIAIAPSRGAAGLHSRHAARRAVAPDVRTSPAPFAAAVGRLAQRYGPLVVYPGQEASIDAVVGALPHLPRQVRLPYPGAAALEAIRDKGKLPELAAEAGLATPATFAEGTAAELLAAPIRVPCAVKAGGPGGAMGSTSVLESPDAAGALLGALPPEEPLLVQEVARGPLLSLALVLDPSGPVVARFQQVARRTWPSDAGISSEAVSVLADERLTERSAAMLSAAGFWGLAQLQFIDAAAGPLLIDVNPRFYGSLPLALAAGVNLPAAWHAVSTGAAAPAQDGYRVGVTYRWLEPDVIEAVRGRPGRLLRRPPPPRVGAIWAPDDPLPGALLAWEAARRMVRGRLRRWLGR